METTMSFRAGCSSFGPISLGDGTEHLLRGTGCGWDIEQGELMFEKFTHAGQQDVRIGRHTCLITVEEAVSRSSSSNLLP